MSYQPFVNPMPVSQSGSWSISFSSAQAVTQSGTWNIGSITTLPALPTGANTIGAVNLAQYTPVTGRLPVDGSGVTQPVSIAAPVAVTGTFYQATQPVSIAGTVSVSGPLTDTELRATAVPVSGTFWQATQPVSGTVAATQSGTWNIGSITTLPSLVAGSAIIGSVKITDGTNTISLDQNNNDGAAATEWTIPAEAYGMVYNGTTWDRARGDTTSGAWVNVKASANLTVVGAAASGAAVSGNPVLTAGSDGTNARTMKVDANGLQRAHLDGTGRTYITLWAVAAAAGTTTTETAITLTRSTSPGAATGTGTSFTPTNGKRFRITSISVATRGNNTATAQTTTFNFRVNTGGAVTTGSNIALAARSATPATANAWDRYSIPLGDAGIEIVGDGTVQFGITAAATYTTNAPTWDVVITGYEY